LLQLFIHAIRTLECCWWHHTTECLTSYSLILHLGTHTPKQEGVCTPEQPITIQKPKGHSCCLGQLFTHAIRILECCWWHHSTECLTFYSLILHLGTPTPKQEGVCVYTRAAHNYITALRTLMLFAASSYTLTQDSKMLLVEP